MKVGVLVWALSLQLLLLTATVLSHSTGIDRTMKTGVVLFLLGSIHSVVSDPPKKSKVDRCRETMTCFAPESCDRGTEDNAVESKYDLDNTCKVILKLRTYSRKLYRIVIESRDTTVDEITVKKEGIELFGCKFGEEPRFNGETIKSITRSTEKPLMCEFIAKQDDEKIIENVDKPFEIATNTGFTSRTKEKSIFAGTDSVSYCDPEHIRTVYDSSMGGPGESIADSEILTIGLADLTCAAPYEMKTKLKKPTVESSAVKTQSIECTKVEGIDVTYEFIVKRTDGEFKLGASVSLHAISCVSQTCSLCEYTATPVSGTAPTIETDADGCKKLKCTDGDLRVGEIKGEVTCKKKDDAPTWFIGETPILDLATIGCAQKRSCSDVRKMCNRAIANEQCIMEGPTGLPKCIGPTRLTYNSNSINISCNGETGKWESSGIVIPNSATLSCTSSGSSSDSQSSPSSANSTLIGCIVAAVIVCAILGALGGFYFYRQKKNKKKNEIGKDANSAAPPLSKSQESKASKKEDGDPPAPPPPPPPKLKYGADPSKTNLAADLSPENLKEFYQFADGATGQNGDFMSKLPQTKMQLDSTPEPEPLRNSIDFARNRNRQPANQNEEIDFGPPLVMSEPNDNAGAAPLPKSVARK